MKLATFLDNHIEQLGIYDAQGRLFKLQELCSHPLAAAANMPALSTDIGSLLAKDELNLCRRVADWLDNVSEDTIAALTAYKVLVDPNDVDFCAPVPRPSFILAQGLAYKEHLHEMGVPTPENPVCLIKAPSSLIGTGQPILLPYDYPSMVDWEGEFSIVIGRVCHGVSESEAMDYVAGYTIINDVSARDWVAKALNPDQTPMQAIATWGDNIHGKQFPTFTPMGPAFVSADEVPDPHALELVTRVNGEIMQQTKTDDLIFSIPYLISHFSKWYKFLPGDIITTGTPSGVGHGRKPPIYLKDGDVVEVSVSKVGVLSNPVQLPGA